MKIQNKRSYAVTIGNATAQPGETVEVPDDIGAAALEQPDNWAPETSKPPKPVADGKKES